jgi:hypothetical protein
MALSQVTQLLADVQM